MGRTLRAFAVVHRDKAASRVRWPRPAFSSQVGAPSDRDRLRYLGGLEQAVPRGRFLVIVEEVSAMSQPLHRFTLLKDGDECLGCGSSGVCAVGTDDKRVRRDQVSVSLESSWWFCTIPQCGSAGGRVN